MKHKRKLKKIDLQKFVSKTAKRGSIPGTIEYIGQAREEKIKIEILEFNEATTNEAVVSSVDVLKTYLEHQGIKWIQITGVHNSEILSEIGRQFNIISLDLEDIANTTQRPRIEEREDYIFMVFKVIQLEPETREVNIEQVSIIPVSYTHLRAHETDSYLVCRLLLEKKKKI